MSAKNYETQLMCVKVIAIQRCVIVLRHSVLSDF